MFFIAAIVILIISFLIALVSLLREQRKVHRLNMQHQQGNPLADTPQQDTTASAQIVEEPVEKPEEVAVPPLVESLPEEQAEGTATDTRVDEETVPFPWEVKSGNDVIPKTQPQVMQTDDRLPNITNSVPDSQVTEESQVLEPKNAASTSAPTLGLNGSVSLKDLKK